MGPKPYLLPVDDGLRMRISGPWVAQKLDYLSRYIDVFETAMRTKFPKRAYIDLFSGPGKCRVRDSGEIRLGSPLIALTTKYQFTDYYFVEKDQVKLNALEERWAGAERPAHAHFIPGDANEIVPSLAMDLRTIPSLNLAFLDPDGLQLAWATVAALARAGRVDLIIHYPQRTLNRVMANAIKVSRATPVDKFFGGEEWRPIYQSYRRGEESFLHRQLMDHYKGRLGTLGYTETRRDDEVDEEPPMVAEKGVLYRLLFASKDSLGVDFWHKVTQRNVYGQKTLGL